MSGGAHYRLYLMDGNDWFCGVEEFDAADDTAALDAARLSLSRTRFPAAEIWQLARRVATIRNNAEAENDSGAGRTTSPR